jgi:Asp-tRNA(Asn)/Glu-tRNA(Gln) amidotransferase A subunit family amidase
VLKSVLVNTLYEESHTQAPVPWNEELFQSHKKLRIGYITEDSSTMTLPACSSRAVRLAAEKLEKLGHTLVPVSTADHLKMYINILALFFSIDPGRDKGETPVKGFEPLIKAALTPAPIRRLISYWKDRHGNETEGYNLLCKAFKIKSAFDYIKTYQ